MSVSITVNVGGVDETVVKIGMYEMEKKKQAINIIRRTTLDTKKIMKIEAHESPSNRKKSHGQPGDLRNSISHKYHEQGLIGVIYPKLSQGTHRAINEHGTVQRFTKKGYNRGVWGSRIGAKGGTHFMHKARLSQDTVYNAKMKAAFITDKTEV